MSSFKEIHKRSLTQGGTSTPNLAIRSSASGLNNLNGVTALGTTDTITAVGNETGETTLSGETMVVGATSNIVTVGNNTCTIELIGTTVVSDMDASTGLVTIGSRSTGTNIGNSRTDTTVRRLVSRDVLKADAGVKTPFVIGTDELGVTLGNPTQETSIVGSVLTIATPNLVLLGKVSAFSYECDSAKVVVGAENTHGIEIGNSAIDTTIFNLKTIEKITTPSVDSETELLLGTTSESVTVGSVSAETTIHGSELNIGTGSTGTVYVGRNSTHNTPALQVAADATDVWGDFNVKGGSLKLPIGTVSCTHLQPSVSTSRFDFATTQTSGDLNIGTADSRTGTVYVGRNSTHNTPALQVAADATNVWGDFNVRGGNLKVHVGTVTCNNLDATNTSQFQCLNSLVGDLNIATAWDRTGATNLMTGANASGDINVGTGANASGKITIGNIKNAVNVGGLQVGLNAVEAQTTSTDLVIGSRQTSGVLYLGAGNGVARTGGILIASAPSTSAPVYMLSGTSASGDFNVLTGDQASGDINMGTAANYTGQISIGSASSKAVNVGGLQIGLSAIDPPSGDDFNIAANQTGNLNIGTADDRMGVVNVGKNTIHNTPGLQVVTDATNVWGDLNVYKGKLSFPIGTLDPRTGEVWDENNSTYGDHAFQVAADATSVWGDFNVYGGSLSFGGVKGTVNQYLAVNSSGLPAWRSKTIINGSQPTIASWGAVTAASPITYMSLSLPEAGTYMINFRTLIYSTSYTNYSKGPMFRIQTSIGEIIDYSTISSSDGAPQHNMCRATCFYTAAAATTIQAVIIFNTATVYPYSGQVGNNINYGSITPTNSHIFQAALI